MSIFGTDGVRGLANSGSLTPDNIMKIAVAATAVLGRKSDEKLKVVIGKDTRLSGYMVENSLTAGFVASGTDVLLVGPIPTPGVSMLIRSMRADLGVMISASHNLYHDNGIKIFGRDGFKISDETQAKIESIVKDPLWHDYLAGSSSLGKAKRIDDAAGRYIEFVKNTFPRKFSLSGLRIVIDSANGAAYQIAPTILWELGAEVISIGNEPNGYNINDKYGSTDLSNLISEVKKTRADLGIALDGDADRLIMIDEKGNIIDGDMLIAIIATSWKKENKLSSDNIVTTIMSNMGLQRYFSGIGMNLIRAKVGDRFVMQEMRNNNTNLGGEQSGHIIMSDYTTTGDGLIAALQVIAVILEQKKPVSEVCKLFDLYPQVQKSVKFTTKSPLENDNIQEYIKDVSTKCSDNARIVVRQSGTEKLIRILVEGEDSTKILEIANDIEFKINSTANLK